MRHPGLQQDMTNLTRSMLPLQDQLSGLQKRLQTDEESEVSGGGGGGGISQKDQQSLLNLSASLQLLKHRRAALQAVSEGINALRKKAKSQKQQQASTSTGASAAGATTGAATTTTTKEVVQSTAKPVIQEEQAELLQAIQGARRGGITLRKVLPPTVENGKTNNNVFVLQPPGKGKATSVFKETRLAWTYFLPNISTAREIFANEKEFPKRGLDRPVSAIFDSAMQAVNTLDATTALNELLPLPRTLAGYNPASLAAKARLDQFLTFVLAGMARALLQLRSQDVSRFTSTQQQCLAMRPSVTTFPQLNERMTLVCDNPDVAQAQLAESVRLATLYALTPSELLLKISAQSKGKTPESRNGLLNPTALSDSGTSLEEMMRLSARVEQTLISMEAGHHTFDLRTKSGAIQQALVHSRVYDALAPDVFPLKNSKLARLVNRTVLEYLAHHLQSTTLPFIQAGVLTHTNLCRQEFSKHTSQQDACFVEAPLCEQTGGTMSTACRVAGDELKRERMERETIKETTVGDGGRFILRAGEKQPTTAPPQPAASVVNPQSKSDRQLSSAQCETLGEDLEFYEGGSLDDATNAVQYLELLELALDPSRTAPCSETFRTNAIKMRNDFCDSVQKQQSSTELAVNFQRVCKQK